MPRVNEQPKSVEVVVTFKTGEVFRAAVEKVTDYKLETRRETKQVHPKKGDTAKRYRYTGVVSLDLFVKGKVLR